MEIRADVERHLRRYFGIKGADRRTTFEMILLSFSSDSYDHKTLQLHCLRDRSNSESTIKALFHYNSVAHNVTHNKSSEGRAKSHNAEAGAATLEAIAPPESPMAANLA